VRSITCSDDLCGGHALVVVPGLAKTMLVALWRER
jgi:hypothetical protein